MQVMTMVWFVCVNHNFLESRSSRTIGDVPAVQFRQIQTSTSTLAGQHNDRLDVAVADVGRFVGHNNTVGAVVHHPKHNLPMLASTLLQVPESDSLSILHVLERMPHSHSRVSHIKELLHDHHSAIGTATVSSVQCNNNMRMCIHPYTLHSRVVKHAYIYIYMYPFRQGTVYTEAHSASLVTGGIYLCPSPDTICDPLRGVI